MSTKHTLEEIKEYFNKYNYTVISENYINNKQKLNVICNNNHHIELDIYLPNSKKAIEFNGIYWHGEEKQKCRDKQKIIQCGKKTIKLLVIDEYDWLTNKENCLNKIKEFLRYRYL